MKNRLVPIAAGSTVTWFKKQTFDLVDIPNLTFSLDVYAYICNARPDEKFEENGGELNVVVVQRGHIKYVGAIFRPELDLNLEISQMTSIIAEPVDELEANSTEKSHKYRIDFAESKVMFKDQGNSTFEAQLEYQDDLTRTDFKQSVENRKTIQYWKILGDFDASPNDIVPFFGLSVFKSTQNLPTLTISHPIIGGSTKLATEDSKMDLNFTYKPPTEI